MTDSLFSTVNVTIAQGGSVSTSFAMGEAIGIERIEMPAAWTENPDLPYMSFLGSQDNVTFRPVFFEELEQRVQIAAGRSVGCWPALGGLKNIKLVAPIEQEAVRTITVVLRNPAAPTEVNVTVSSPPA